VYYLDTKKTLWRHKEDAMEARGVTANLLEEERPPARTRPFTKPRSMGKTTKRCAAGEYLSSVPDTDILNNLL